jgi:hypothetical protein
MHRFLLIDVTYGFSDSLMTEGGAQAMAAEAAEELYLRHCCPLLGAGGMKSMVSNNLLVEIEPENSRFSTGSEKWLREREDLRSNLQRELGPDSIRQGRLADGDKGLPLVPIIVALGGAHAFQSLARCLESWLRYRPGERSLRMTATVNGKKLSVQIDASNAPVDALRPIIVDALQLIIKELGDALK